MKIWLSPPPGHCDTCGAPIIDVFYDAKTNIGPWACMCPTCHTLGPGLGKLGPGFGQEYKLTFIDTPIEDVPLNTSSTRKMVWKKTAG